jgi:Domain of unknown function (DUF1844)
MAEPEEDETQGRGFKVIDRRGAAEAAAEPEAAAPPPRPAEAAPRAEPPQQPPELPKIDFATFVLSLFTSALYQMGLAPDPASGEPVDEPNLLVARQTIDTLELLEAKTRGNLDPEEAGLLENALFELRMRFVELSK